MCVLANDADRHRKKLVAIGSGCLAAGTGLWTLTPQAISHDRHLLHAVVDFYWALPW
jgi:hypothetical protein